MFAAFSRETAMPPVGLLSPTAQSSDTEKVVSSGGNAFGKYCQSSADQKSVELGNGNTFSYTIASCQHASHGSVSCLFAGQLDSRPSLTAASVKSAEPNSSVEEEELIALSDAKWLLAFYKMYQQYAQQGIAGEALANLAKLEGSFAFVVYDRAARKVLAARDRNGSESLFWGFTADGSLLFSSVREELAECNPSATAFPSGSLFLSETKAKAVQPGEAGWMIGHQLLPGAGLLSFVPRTSANAIHPYRQVKAFPRINSRGSLCGAVYKVASESNMGDLNLMG